MVRFILADGSVNRRGFRLSMSGLNLEPFKKNPVMLFAHEGRNMPIGRWDNITVEDGKVLAEAVFDTNDQFALSVQSKVDGGFLKGASAAIVPVGDDPWDYDTDTMLPGQTLPTLKSWTIEEASICGIPVNSNCLKLSTVDGPVTIREDDAMDTIKLSAYFSNLKAPLNNKPMKKIAETLGLAADATEDQIIAGIVNLKLATTKPGKNVSALLLASAKTAGIVNDGGDEPFLKLATSDAEAVAEVILSKLPSKPAEANKQQAEAGKQQEQISVKEELLKLATKQEAEQKQQAEDRSKWTYKEWFDKDPDGLMKLATTDKKKFDAIPMA